MNDDLQNGGSGDTAEIEALLRELTVEDLDRTPPPPSVWDAIQEELQSTSAPVVSIARRRRRATWMWAAAAVVLLISAGVVGLAVTRDDQTELVSAVALEHDPATFDPRGADASAVARLVEIDGHYEIELTDANLPSLAGDDLELWLIEPDADGNPVDVAPVALISGSQRGSYRVPDVVDPRSHFVVDISIEPRDGDAAHSGHSILRGALETA